MSKKPEAKKPEAKKPARPARKPAVQPEAQQVAETAAVENAEQPPPICPYHPKQECQVDGTDPLFKRVYCPIDGCSFFLKVAKPNAAARLRREHAASADYSAR